ncbi:MAG: hypothetical protein JSV99_11295 [Planctomycetota bacterium]|nr:MAG: hypothetical protein JSV99_11295 [Planctomycetota bacterium]
MKSGSRNYHGLVAMVIVVACTCGAGFGAPVYIPGVPDWDQPALAAGQSPAGSWGAWCTPTATANIVGYYNDNGVGGIGDSNVFPATPPWTDPDWQDDTADASGGPRADLGWYFNTNDIGLGGNPGSPTYRGTKLEHILNGTAGNGGLVGAGSGYFPSAGLTSVCVGNYGSYALNAGVYAKFDTNRGEPNQVYHTDEAGFVQIWLSIDGNRPLLGHFEHFELVGRTDVNDFNGFSDFNEVNDFDWADWGEAPIYGPNGYTDEVTGEVWDPNRGLGHTVTIVGYWLGGDAGNPLGADAIIVHDNRDGRSGSGPLPLLLPWAGSPWMGLTLINGIASPYYELSGDCFVNLLDLKLLASDWLE